MAICQNDGTMPNSRRLGAGGGGIGATTSDEGAMTENPTRIAVVGAGFTGTVFAVHLLRAIDRPVEIRLYDRCGNFGRGLAYSARNPHHLLNVRVSNMSMFDDDPQHFIRWLWRNEATDGKVSDIPPSGHAFVSRATYGAYVEDVFHSAVREAEARGGTVIRAEDDVVDLAAAADGLVLRLADGQAVGADRAVLSVGNFPPSPPFPLDPALTESGRYIGDPWEAGAIDRIGPDDSVLIVGTGLTMVDVVLDLAAQGHRGPVHALSRRGLLPHRHELTRPYPSFLDEKAPPASLVQLMRLIRREVRAGAAQGYDWRSVMDAVRPIVAALWRGLSNVERRRFLRHLRPYWEVHRHRLAPSIADRIDAWRAAGRLVVGAGRIDGATFEDGQVRVIRRRRDGGSGEPMAFDWMINCSGPECDYRRIGHPLIQSLLATGLARLDPLSLGLDLTERFELVGPANRVYALGPPTRGMWWETTAVPDIRKQCARFAGWLAEDIAAGA